MKEAAGVIEALSDDAIAAIIEGGTAVVLGEHVTLDDLIVGREPRQGVVVASDDRLSVALDTTLTAELEREGLAREMVKVIQALRREADLDVADRITVRWDTTDGDVAAAIEAHASWISGEVLAASIERDPGGAPQDVIGSEVTVAIDRV